MEKQNRKLSGIFLRHQRANWCFEDLPIEEQNKFMDRLNVGQLKRLALQLADTINKIADKYDITKDTEI